MQLPPEFTKRIIGVFKGAGQAWLDGLPALIDELAAEWGLAVEPPFEPLSYNYVAPATLPDGSETVLKIGVPDQERRSEIAALAHWQETSAVRLLRSDPARGASLLERISPGETLDTIGDEEQEIEIAANIMRELWMPPPADLSEFISLPQWGSGFGRLRERFDGGSGPLPAKLVDEAERVWETLLATSDAPIVLHGDLHHYNILRGADGWRLIDPKGLLGEPAYEPIAFLWNPLGIVEREDARAIMDHRIARIATLLDLDPQRIRGWAFTHAMLSTWWEFEDYGRESVRWLRTASLLRPPEGWRGW